MILSLVLSAAADIGPRPTCPAGTHNEYLYGNHCVKDGYHLEQGADGGVTEVKDPGPPVDPNANATPVVEPVKEETKCSTTGGFFGVALALAGFAAAVGRRKG